ncbi:Increased DNA methylation 1, partial [Cucurbita argyrosperma subsp. sororia]
MTTRKTRNALNHPAPPLRNWGNIKTPPSPPQAAAGSTSQRHPRIALSNLIDQSVVSPGDRANFEAHTGSTKRRPAANIFLEDGRSLLDCQMQIDQNQNQNQNETKGHPTWGLACPSCCCKICGQIPYNFDGVVSDHQPDASLVKCVQCEQNVHIGCVRSVQFLEDGNPNQAMDRENWSCTKRCEDIHMGLQKLLWKRNPVGVNYQEEAEHCSWRNAWGVSAFEGSQHEPRADEDVVFGRRSNSKRLNFEGFYTVILERKKRSNNSGNSESLWEEVAEVPFVVTRLRHRRHGMCRTLMNELERQLMKLGVKTLTLPAVELAKYTLLGFPHTVRCQKDLEKRISNDAEWCPMKWPTPSVEEHDISVEEHDILDHMSFDDWSSISRCI